MNPLTAPVRGVTADPISTSPPGPATIACRCGFPFLVASLEPKPTKCPMCGRYAPQICEHVECDHRDEPVVQAGGKPKRFHDDRCRRGYHHYRTKIAEDEARNRVIAAAMRRAEEAGE